MEENIKALIDKIQQEGVDTAREKARGIEEQAKKEAEKIVLKAKADAEKIISASREKAQKEEEGTRALLSQASRDMLLALQRQIQKMLQDLIRDSVRQAFAPAELARIISGIIKEQCAGSGSELSVSLSEADCEYLKKAFSGELKEAVKKGVVLKPSGDIRAGFTISYDAGKSSFDFTDQALAGYIGEYLKPKLAKILSVASGESR